MQKVTPFLAFDGRAEEATRFYVTLFPDSRIEKITRTPMDVPGCPAGSVLVVEFTLAGVRYVALNAPDFKMTEAFSLQVNCTDQAEVDRLWTALTANGGSESQCGWLKDRWGMFWQITPVRLMELIADPDTGRAKRVMESMMTMGKLDIAELERAAAKG